MLTVDVIQRLLLAAALGAAIGLEREYRQKPAGLRTNMLIALGIVLGAPLRRTSFGTSFGYRSQSSIATDAARLK